MYLIKTCESYIRIMKKIVFLIMLAAFLVACSARPAYADLQRELAEFVDGKDARIGVAVVVDGRDAASVNGDMPFPMLSVYKFPIALALAEKYRNEGRSLNSPIAVTGDDLHPDTYSPMTEKILSSALAATDTLRMPALDLLAYMLQLSDNNASDVVLRHAGGAESVDNYLSSIGIRSVNVRNSEDEMHADNSLCYANSSTPLAMARLMDRFDREFSDSTSLSIKRLMETCETGSARLAKPLLAMNAVIGHKTGTGFPLPDGGIMAVNDAGYVHLPDGRRYAIAVFIADSHYSPEATEAIIAEISQIVLETL